MTVENQQTSNPALFGRLSLPIIVGFVILVQFISRYAAAPIVDFTCDAWDMLRMAEEQTDWSSVWRQMRHEPDRPLQAGVLIATFKLLGDQPALYMMVSMLLYSLHIMLCAGMVWELTGDKRTVLIFGLVFALLPNLYESFHWGAMIAVIYMQIAYVASAWCWILYVKRTNPFFLALSVFFYAVGVTSYEFGALLPLVYAVLVLRKNDRVKLWMLSPYMLVLALYAIWRLTNGFGQAAHGVLFPPRDVVLSFELMIWNTKEVIRWWAGEHMISALSEGLRAYLTVDRWHQRLLLMVNIVITILSVILIKSDTSKEAEVEKNNSTFSSWQLVLFALAWAVTGHSVSLVSWTAARLNYFPAIGLTMIIAWFLARWDTRKWIPAFVVIMPLCLIVNQGTAQSWKDSGTFQRNMFEQLTETKRSWEAKNIILFDTKMVRHRLTRGLLPPPSGEPYAWAYYGNASLLRGFVPRAMIELLVPDRSKRPRVLLDPEHGARMEGDTLYWHARYDPSIPYETPMRDVHVVECFAAGSGEGRTR